MAFLDLEGLKRIGQRLDTLFLRKASVANNLTTTSAGKALDARQGKALKDAINGKTAKKNSKLRDGDEVMLMSPVCGG